MTIILRSLNLMDLLTKGFPDIDFSFAFFGGVRIGPGNDGAD